jgi:MarR family transcriptional regulator, organic hydroperoxide resistance regulator
MEATSTECKLGTDLKVLFNELIRLEIELWDAVDQRLRTDCDLPLSRFEPMQVIARHPECRVQDIAAELAITTGGVSKLVDRIEACGHCRRRTNPQDRRSSIIELTPAGRRLLAKATTVFENELAARLTNAVSEQQAEQLIRTLRRLRAAIRPRRPHT